MVTSEVQTAMQQAVRAPGEGLMAEITEREAAFGKALLDLGKILPTDLTRVQRAQSETGRCLTDVLIGLGLVTERDIAAAFAGQLDLPITQRSDYPTAPLYAEELPKAFLAARRLLPTMQKEGRVVLAMVNPMDDFAARAVAMKLGLEVDRSVALPSELEEALEALYGGDGRSTIEEIVDSLESETDGGGDDAERLRDLASEAPVIRLVSMLIGDSVERGASDIHIEPFENRLRVRYRIDGIMHEVVSHPSRLRFAIISRIKIMAKLNIAERRLPQDGRIRLSVRGNEVDLRISTVPTDYGETVVLRVLDRSKVVLDFDRLGIEPDNRDAFRALLKRHNGIVLVTGPTGSGKTTTLYTALTELNSPDRKILTVEDPIEYRLEGINQIAVKPQIGLGFADILRSLLRQDPDIIMVGEIRDLETAQISVQAALTGHLVLSTVHTNSAAGTVTRLLEMGVESYLLNSTLAGVVAQRLVRRLCPACRVPHRLSDEMIDQLDIRELAAKDGQLYDAVGCVRCGGKGFAGRLCVSEVLTINDDIRSLVLKNAGETDIARCAMEHGMRTMYRDGMGKALRGETTIEEVLRVTRDEA
ncbi:MAG: general secretion pathway protein E [Alphaproteobacteria bacterium]